MNSRKPLLRTGVLLVTGASGLLGSNIARRAGTTFRLVAVHRSHPISFPDCTCLPLDITNPDAVNELFRSAHPDLVLHTAAIADVDYCEDHPEKAWNTNVEGTANVAQACRKIGAKLVHISTDAVFDGTRGLYREEDEPHPINTYARTKLEAERRVMETVPESLIIRTAFYGRGPSGRKGLAEWTLEQLRRGEPFPMFTDVFFSPIYIGDLIEIIFEAHAQGLAGIYHVGSRERCSKHEFGMALARTFGFDPANLKAGVLADVPLRAPRPKDISLDTSRISRALGRPMPGLEEGLQRFRKDEGEERNA